MTLEDVIAVVDATTAQDIRDDRSKTVQNVYDDYIGMYFYSDEPLTPESFIEFWKDMTHLDKIRFLVDQGY